MNDYQKHFPYLKRHQGVIYFDNAATSLKPQMVIDAEREYLEAISANPHTGDYAQAFEASEILTTTRAKVLKFLHAPKNSEVIFTSGTTHSLNQVVSGIAHLIKSGDEICTTTLEHSSTLLPIMNLCETKKIKLNLLPLKADGTIDCENLKNCVNAKTKLIAFASSTNVLGGHNDMPKVVKAIRQINPQVIIVIDAAQSVAHEVIDLEKWDVDLLAFSAHKIFGPFGVGVLWGKKAVLEQLTPIFFGGGMSGKVSCDLSGFDLQPLPDRLEGGTPNISGIYGFLKALEFIEQIGMKNIVAQEVALKKYAIKKAQELPEGFAHFYNLNNEGPLLTFNIKDYNPQDIATFFWVKYQIQVRSGSHCARIVNNQKVPGITARASFSFFNTFEEIDKLFEAIKNSDNFIDAIL